MAVHGPDSGYSWVIVVCCAYIHFALFGLFRSAGVVFVAILQTFEVSREDASWSFALCAAIFQLVGPLAHLSTRYISQRKACLMGSAVATFGIGACYFAESVMWINICYGVIHGLGFGFAVTFVPVILNQYFLKYRATAMGIAFAGGTVSSLLFPLVMEWLLEKYTLNDSFLLLSGVVMNTLVAASLLREPPWLKPSANKENFPLEHSDARDSGVSTSDDGNELKSKTTPIYLPQDTTVSAAVSTDHIDKSVYEVANQDNFQCVRNGAECVSDRTDFDTLRSNNDSVLFETSESKMMHSDAAFKNLKNGEDLAVKQPLMNSKEVTIIAANKLKILEGISAAKTQHSISYVLRQPMFHLITFSMAVYFLGVHSFFMVIVDFAKDKGIPESDGIYIISMFSLTDLFGRAGLGWVTDRNFIRRKTLVGVNLAILGALYQLYPLVQSLPGILALAAIGGVAVGSSITMFFVLQAECLGMNVLTLVVGMTSFINGCLSLLRPGIIGLFRDVIGSYNWMFHFIGILTLLFSGVWLAESWKSRHEGRPSEGQDSKV